MVLVLTATGARFSQVQRIRVGDVQSDRLRIFVPTSRKGRGKNEGHYPVQVKNAGPCAAGSPSGERQAVGLA